MPSVSTVRAATLLREGAGRAVERAADLMVAALYPQGCHVCGGTVVRRAAGVACDACWSDPQVTRMWAGLRVCSRCGLPAAVDCVDGEGDCAGDSLTAVRSAGSHAGALRACVLDLKRRPRVCARLRDALLAAVDAAPFDGVELVVPVPLHPRRRAERGFNQAELLAAVVSRAGGLALVPNALARTSPAPRLRSGLDRRGRREAVAGAFRAAAGLVAGRRVLLVDDVFTTGATLAACSDALRTAGATDVAALTVARAVGPRRRA